MLLQKPKLSDAIQIDEQDEVISIFNNSTGKVFITNHVGRTVFELCNGVYTVGDILDNIAKVYVSQRREELEKDITNFLSECVKKGVIIWSG
ncbi:MAG: Coenzyme PQQ synthesis protein D [Syntrophomonadaceae bacterium]|nr:Coenzyme PQQ synthesis protein D [Bacillota bacterium]